MPPQEKTGICNSVRPKRRYCMTGFNMAAFCGCNDDPEFMAKLLLVILVAATVAAIWSAWPLLQSRFFPDDFQKLDGPVRVAKARANRGHMITGKFRAAGLAYPGEIFLRWFKHEATLELWARNGVKPFRLVTTWPILASSGAAGPKRREGDRQVPEGVYEIERFNPESLYHLSLGLNYPNASDRILSDPQAPGSDIFIHGKAVSIGCAPIGDSAIEELYLAVLDARDAGQASIAVHIFPARMNGVEWTQYSEAHPALRGFWTQLQPAFDAFERTHRIPATAVTADGRYQLATDNP
jgi:murein L,D-transpeptidase YafK